MSLMRSTQQRTHLRAVAVAGLLIMCGLHIVLVISSAAAVLPLGGDANAYLAAARAITHGQLPVGENGTPFLPEAGAGIPPYLYPPFLALALVPLASLPYPAALYLWLILVATTTVFLIYLLRPLVGWAAAIIGVLFFLPTWESLWLGQINALVAVLITGMLRENGRRRAGTLGVALALGTLLKVTPVLAALIFVAHRRWRSIGVAALTLTGVVILSLPLVSLDAWYSGSLYALRSAERSSLFLSWTAILRNQPGQASLIGPPVLIISTLIITAWRSRCISFRFGLAATAILPLLISSIIWHYTAILALPALAVLWQHNPRARLIALTTWAFIALIGGVWQPVMLSLCWCVCCWPRLLGPEDISGERVRAGE
ncbi:MAG: glycosyltransferase family 87 protein [Chloroflexales bacterium]